MVLLRSLVLPALSLVGAASASSVKALTPDTFDADVFAGVPSLVEFFAPWCGHCKKLAPVYDELADSFKHAKGVNIASVDGDAHKSLSSTYGISGFPTIKFFDGKSKDPVDYNGGRDLEAMQAYVQEKTGVKPKKKAAVPSDVVHATDKSFGKIIGGAKNVLVAFTAPWCGHCKTLAPIWEEVAHDFSLDDDVEIVKVDAEAYKELATKYEVTGYPTIKFFPKGSTEAEAFSTGRDEASIVNFVNEKAGTHRVVGGGLDATAGTIEALDTIVSTLTGSNLADVSAEAQKAAKGLQGKYAEYYVKVLAKLADNKDYASKELARLQNMVSKGGIARPKADDLSSRLNILKKFVTGEDARDEL